MVLLSSTTQGASFSGEIAGISGAHKVFAAARQRQQTPVNGGGARGDRGSGARHAAAAEGRLSRTPTGEITEKFSKKLKR